MLRGRYAYYGIAGNMRALQRVRRNGRTLLAQDVEQPGLARAGLVEGIPTDQGAVSVAAAKVVSPLLGAASYRRAAGNLHATFCGSRGAGDCPRPLSGRPCRDLVDSAGTQFRCWMALDASPNLISIDKQVSQGQTCRCSAK
jgi:hypothetical protein